MQTKPTPPTAPTAKQAAEFLKVLIKELEPLHKAKTIKQARAFFDEYFDEEWTDYHTNKWPSRKKNGGGVAGWICNLDYPRMKLLLEDVLLGTDTVLVIPEIEVSEYMRRYNDKNRLGYNDNELKEMERQMSPIGYATYPWQLVVAHKYAIYCLNNSGTKIIRKKVYNCIDWGWSAWFTALTEVEQEAFAGMIIQYQ